MKRKQVWFGLQIVITLFLLIMLLRNFDWASFAGLFGKIPPVYYLYFLGLLVAGQVVYAFRWFLVLRSLGVQVSFRRVVEQYMLSIFFSNFLPTAIGGDWAKVYYLGQQKGYVTVGASVFIDRFLGFFSMTLIGTVLLWWLRLTEVPFIVARDALTAGSAAFILVFVVTLAFPVEDWLHDAMARYAWLDRPGQVLYKFLGQVKTAGQNPLLVLAALGTVVLYFVLVGTIYTTYFAFTAGQSINFGALMAVLMSIAILTNIPISVNGIGFREQLHYLLFDRLGIPKEVAVSISLLILFNFLVISGFGYMLWLRLKIAKNLVNAKT